jgi:hypothetical protein
MKEKIIRKSRICTEAALFDVAALCYTLHKIYFVCRLHYQVVSGGIYILRI